jgi:hypothetical protein
MKGDNIMVKGGREKKGSHLNDFGGKLKKEKRIK